MTGLEQVGWGSMLVPMDVWDSVALYGLLTVMLPLELTILLVVPLGIQLLRRALRGPASRPTQLGPTPPLGSA